jgi:nuclear pore complex protein Nup98-Nup96
LTLTKRNSVSDGAGGREAPGIRFDPALSAAAREREKEKERERESAARFTSGEDKENAAPRYVGPSSGPSGSSSSAGAKSKTSRDAVEGEYWCRPSVEELIEMDHAQLSRVPNFTVGRVGYGEITFLQPVDLTTVGAVRDIPGGVVVFLEREAVVYPDDVSKPPAGEGLNVPAEVRLDKVWAMDKSSKEPIKDENHVSHRRLLRKLQNYPNTRFLGFDMEPGRWRFEVTGF